MSMTCSPVDWRLGHLLESYQRYFGVELCRDVEELWAAPFAVLAHGAERPPRLFYGNQTALQLWELAWSVFVGLPSSQTAEPEQRAGRAELIERVRQEGCAAGIPVSASAAAGVVFV
jgi:hypothetical protein